MQDRHTYLHYFLSNERRASKRRREGEGGGGSGVATRGSPPPTAPTSPPPLPPALPRAILTSSTPPSLFPLSLTVHHAVLQAYTLNSVGGSPECSAAIAAGHATIGTMFTTAKGRSALATEFGQSAEWYASRAHQQAFAGNGVASFPAQSNDPSCMFPGCNINSICMTMTDTKIGTPLQRLAKLRAMKANAALSAPEARVDGLELAIRARQRVAILDAARAAGNGTLGGSDPLPLSEQYWAYQTCTEFGFYQTCEVGSKCFFTQGLVLLSDSDSFCAELYKIEPAAIQASINATNAYYGALHPEGPPSFGSRLLYPNGDVDPWHGLSILTPSPEGNVSTLIVSGASHHAWTHSTMPTDQVRVLLRALPSPSLLARCPRAPSCCRCCCVSRGLSLCADIATVAAPGRSNLLPAQRTLLALPAAANRVRPANEE